ncbi:MAG: hypothetical protein KAS32_07120 [Candidatus Peribacteraceae bacterium]|nr:hypothetical protein [Candidatus Peribacteraceae bacterium]
MTDFKMLTIDDIRTIPGTHHVRTYEDAIKALQKETWDVVYLDHDLNVECVGKTGYDIMCWIEQHPEHLPKRIELITMNPSGRIRMQQVIDKLYGR